MKKYNSAHRPDENGGVINGINGKLDLPEKAQEALEFNLGILGEYDRHKLDGGNLESFCDGKVISPPGRSKSVKSPYNYLKRLKRRRKKGKDTCFDRRLVNPGRRTTLQDGPAQYILACRYRFFKWTARAIRESLKDYIDRLNLGWKLPSLKQIRDFLNKLPEDLKTFCFHGKREWWEEFGPCTYGKLLPSNELWVADSTALTGLKFIDEKGKEFTPWMTFILDAGSRFLVAAWLHDEKFDAETMLALLREAMLPKASGKYAKKKDSWVAQGVPLGWLTDNHPVFISKRIRHCCEKLDTIKKYTFPHHPSQNGRAEIFVRYIKRYVTARIQDICFSKGSPYVKDSVSSLWQLFKLRFTALIEKYNTSEHSVLQGKTPFEWYIENLPPDAFTRIGDEEITDATMMSESRKVDRYGILFRGHRYNGPQTCRLAKKKVTVWFHPLENPCQSVKVYYEGRFVEEAKICDPGCGTDVAQSVQEAKANYVERAEILSETMKVNARNLFRSPERKKNKSRRHKIAKPHHY
ncbi:MAG: Mu transposase C-terminal domain-containing protein [bacterium]